MTAKHEQLARLLDWSRAMGADAVVSDMPTDWLSRLGSPPGAGFSLPPSVTERSQGPSSIQPALGDLQSRSSEKVPEVAIPRPLATAPAPQVRPAARPPAVTRPASRGAPSSASSLAALEAELQAFEGCAVKATATKLCFYRGAAQARLMIIGEAPGREEDLEGRPFVGRDGQLVDRMLAAIGLDESHVHMTNVVYWRPPGSRPPTPQEALACRPFLDRQIELVGPEVLLLLGGTVTKHMLGSDDGIMRLRGKWAKLNAGGRDIDTMPTLPPSYLLSLSASKRQTWLDLLLIKERLK